MPVEGGSPELVRRTGTYTEIEQAHDGKLYASLTGGTSLLQIDETETGAFVAEEKALALPEGYTLAGSLPAQTVEIGGTQDQVFARVLEEKEYEGTSEG